MFKKLNPFRPHGWKRAAKVFRGPVFGTINGVGMTIMSVGAIIGAAVEFRDWLKSRRDGGQADKTAATA